jgi:hypothetical protein
LYENQDDKKIKFNDKKGVLDGHYDKKTFGTGNFQKIGHASQ